MPYDINGNYREAPNVSPLPAWVAEYKYATAEEAAKARNGGSSGGTITPASPAASTKIEVSVRISGFLTPA